MLPGSLPDPETQAFIDRYLEVSGLSTATSVAQQRADYGRIVEYFRHPRPPGIESEDSTIQGRHGPVPLRHYRYDEGDTRAQIVFIHGGGFVLGNLDTHDDICADLCASTGFDLVSISYRLAPEFHHPVQLDDVEDGFLARPHANRIVVGASAGGTLAAALSHRLRSSEHKAAGQVLIYPSLGGDQLDLESYRSNARAPLLSTDDVSFYRIVRCKDGAVPTDDPEFFPLLADDFSGLPPTVALTADIDPLRDDSQRYVEVLGAAGIEAEWINEAGLVHDYLRARHASTNAATAFSHICDAITRLALRDTR